MSDVENSPSVNRLSSEEIRVRPYEPFPSFREWIGDPISLATFDEYAAQLDSLRVTAGTAVLQGAIDVATKWAAIDTGAIEGLYEVERGFTITMAVSAALLENIHAIKGEAVARSVEDALDAYEFVLDIATNSRPLTEVWIRELHEKICRSQDTFTVSTAVGPQEHALEKGKYKDLPNSPYNFESAEIHSYAPPDMTSPEMARLVAEIRSDAFAQAHPAIQAAYAHYAFVCVHPFPDGNGRVSRALASVFLYRAPGVPLVIFADQKGAYITALEAADSGQFGTFVRFVSERVVDTIAMVRESIASASAPSVASQLAQLEVISTGRGGLPHAELDAVGIRLLEQFEASANKIVGEQFAAAAVSGHIGRRQGISVEVVPGYRTIPNNPISVTLNLDISRPASAGASRTFSVLVARPGVDAADFLIMQRNKIVLEVFLREVYPTISEALLYRIDAVIDTNLREELAELTAKVEKSLKAQGYSE